ncbi:MAG: sulfatase [Candidatus Hydrogenedentota bacterium]
MTQKTMPRRTFIRNSALGLAASAAGLSHSARGAANGRPPNVVYIICDQMRGDAMGCMGSPNADTPHLDRLAADGTCFSRWFSNHPMCAPSRVSTFTGHYPHTHGRLNNKCGPYPDSAEGTLLGHFAERGYRTGWVGKNHTYNKSDLAGLDTAHIRGRESLRKYNGYVPPWWHSDMYLPEEELHATLNTRDAVEFIHAAKPGDPFFLHVSYFDPHPPYFAPADWAQRFDAREMHLPVSIPPEKLSLRLAAQYRAMQYDRMSEADLRETMRYYHASIAWGVDHQVGRVMGALEETGQLDNTIVVFTSDHGDFMGDHGMVRKGLFHYDGLLHVPMIVHAPGRVKPGHRVTEPCQCVDLFPTLADMTGGAPPEGLPGHSVRPLLEGGGRLDPARYLFASTLYNDMSEEFVENMHDSRPDFDETPVHTEVYHKTYECEHRSIMARNADWKLILHESAPPELYAMNGGTVERENVAGDPAHRAVRRKLEAAIHEEWPW